MGSREKWVRGSLLPNLYARYQARDKRYSSIPVSERQAYLLGCAISTATRREGGLIWQGRTVYLSSRCGMHLVSFGPTEQETTEFLTRDAEHQTRRELESVRAMVRRGKADRIAATLHHTAAARGYISRRSEGVIREYFGRFGTGYAVHTPRRDTTNYHYISYYTREA